MNDYTRQRVLIGAGTGSISGIAGSLEVNDAGNANEIRDNNGTGDFEGINTAPSASSTSGNEKSGQPSIFVFSDFASHVASDVATANTFVPAGQHSLCWQPRPQIQGTILESNLDIFGTECLRLWANKGWSYAEIMGKVNFPSLTKALDAQ